MAKTTTPPARRAADAGTIDQRLVKAMAHPIRYRLLVAFNEVDKASPNQLARRIGAKLPNVSYHVRVLEELGMIELVSRRAVRGAVEHFYRATQRAWFASTDWANVPLGVRRTLIGDTLKAIAQSITTAADAGGFDKTDVHVTYTRLDLDEEAFLAVSTELEESLQRIMEIQANSLSRRDPEAESLLTQVVLMHFESQRP